MTFSVQETLFSLLRLNGISGHESSIANVMQHAFEQQAKDVWRDRLGNVVARYGSDKSDALRLMIFAHMDEVGFMVRKIEPSGFLRFERVGGQPRRRHHLSELSRTRYVGGTDYAAAFAADAGDHRARK